MWTGELHGFYLRGKLSSEMFSDTLLPSDTLVRVLQTSPQDFRSAKQPNNLIQGKAVDSFFKLIMEVTYVDTSLSGRLVIVVPLVLLWIFRRLV